MSKARDADARRGEARSEARPQSVEEALALALRHGRNAIAEAILAGRALLDAAALGLTGHPVTSEGDAAPANDAVRALARAVEGLETLATRLRADDPEATQRLVDALLAALETEIERWEGRAHSDPDARAVLRAFLGLRELLWELGLRPRPKRDASDQAAAGPSKREAAAASTPPRTRARSTRAEPKRAQSPASKSPRRGQRVQRVDIEP